MSVVLGVCMVCTAFCGAGEAACEVQEQIA